MKEGAHERVRQASEAFPAAKGEWCPSLWSSCCVVVHTFYSELKHGFSDVPLYQQAGRQPSKRQAVNLFSILILFISSIVHISPFIDYIHCAYFTFY